MSFTRGGDPYEKLQIGKHKPKPFYNFNIFRQIDIDMDNAKMVNEKMQEMIEIYLKN